MTQREHFDAVIVGSGFGGAATCYHLAEAGLSVCLLKRHKRHGPRLHVTDIANFAKPPPDGPELAPVQPSAVCRGYWGP